MKVYTHQVSAGDCLIFDGSMMILLKLEADGDYINGTYCLKYFSGEGVRIHWARWPWAGHWIADHFFSYACTRVA